jgi:hypothetical protein
MAAKHVVYAASLLSDDESVNRSHSMRQIFRQIFRNFSETQGVAKLMSKMREHKAACILSISIGILLQSDVKRARYKL